MRYFITTLLLLCSFVLQSQTAIKGAVYDDQTNLPLAGVNILISKLNVGTSTNAKGQFQLNEIPKGKYIIEFSFIGYNKFTKTVLANQDTSLQIIRLKKDLLSIEEITISANKHEQLKYVPARIEIIQARNIEESAEQSTSDLLAAVSGINVENTMGTFSSSSTVSLRGMGGNDQSRTLILLDGIPINKSDGGSVNWNMINKENIDAIKITKGPGSAKHGSNAMGGVIDIITKLPNKKLSGNFTANYGTYNTSSGQGNLSGKFQLHSNNQFYWTINGSAKKSDGYITELEEYTDMDDSIIVPVFLEEINTSAKLGYKYKNRHQVEILANYFDDMRGNGIHVFDNYGAYSEHDTWFSVIKYNYRNKRFLAQSSAFLLNENYQRVYEYMREGEYQLYDVDSKRADKGINIDLQWTAAQHTFSYGLMAKNGSVAASDTYYTSTDIISNAGEMSTYAIYLEDAINISSHNIQIILGLRYDNADFNNGAFSVQAPSYSIEFLNDYESSVVNPLYWSAWSPKFSIQKRFSSNTRIYTSYGRGFKAPLLDDMCRTSKSAGSFKIANPHLKPEIVNNIETGIDYELSEHLLVKHSLYFTRGSNFMYMISTGDSVNMGYKIAPIYQIDNISKVHIYGIETDLEYKANKALSAYLNYTYNLSQIKDHMQRDAASDADLSNKYLTNIPNHKVAAGLVWKNKITDLSLSGKYIGTRWINDQNIMDEEYLKSDKFEDYLLIDLKAKRKLGKGFSASVAINNIFNTVYVNKKLQRSPGRFITIQLAYKFSID